MGVTQVRLQRTGVRDCGHRLRLQKSRGVGSARRPKAQWDFGGESTKGWGMGSMDKYLSASCLPPAVCK